jgi:hypothetical protein
VTPTDVERLAEGLPSAFDEVKHEEGFCWGGITNGPPGFIGAAIGLCRDGEEGYYLRADCPEAALAGILREIQGNPFRPALRRCGNQLAVLTKLSRIEAEKESRGNLWLVPGSDLVYDTTAPTAWLSWAGGTISRMVEAIYTERTVREGDLDCGRMAVLADALEEAGCNNETILGHCRAKGPHLLGCWVVDLLLDRR